MSETMQAEATVDTYQDTMGRTQHRVTGPRGTLLVTAAGAKTEVWKSDSLHTLYSGTFAAALAYAQRRVS